MLTECRSKKGPANPLYDKVPEPYNPYSPQHNNITEQNLKLRLAGYSDGYFNKAPLTFIIKSVVRVKLLGEISATDSTDIATVVAVLQRSGSGKSGMPPL